MMTVLLLLLVLFVSSAAAFSPSPLYNIINPHPLSLNRHPQLVYQSTTDSDTDDDKICTSEASSINIALISSKAINDNVELKSSLNEHPFCKMTGIGLSISEVRVEDTLLFHKDDIPCLQQVDIAIFDSTSAVKCYLASLDNYLKIPNDIEDDERRKLPNKLNLEGRVDSVMAACPNTEIAKEALNSGRWMNNHIYYPKDSAQTVELKTEPLDSLKEEDTDEEENVDMQLCVDSVIQAAGDVFERSFWGGGW